MKFRIPIFDDNEVSLLMVNNPLHDEGAITIFSASIRGNHPLLTITRSGTLFRHAMEDNLGFELDENKKIKEC